MLMYSILQELILAIVILTI